MSNAKLSAFPLPQQQDPCTGYITSYTEFGLTKLEYFAALAWTNDEIDILIGETMSDVCMFLGIDESQYRARIHYPLACVKARVHLAKALMAEIEKEQP